MTNRYADFKIRQRPPASARAFAAEPSEFLRRYRDDGEALLAKPFTGLTTDGTPAPGLFTIEKTGVSTRAITDAAEAWLASLAPRQRAEATFPVETEAWRRWSNIHPF